MLALQSDVTAFNPYGVGHCDLVGLPAEPGGPSLRPAALQGVQTAGKINGKKNRDVCPPPELS